MTKAKKVNLEKIPEILEKATGLINREIECLMQKDALTIEDSKSLISYCTQLSVLYKEYRAEVKAIEMDLKGRTKADILSIIKAEDK